MIRPETARGGIRANRRLVLHAGARARQGASEVATQIQMPRRLREIQTKSATSLALWMPAEPRPAGLDDERDGGCARIRSGRDRASAPEGNLTLVLDLRGRIRACSGAAGRLFGHPAGELVGEPVQRLIPELPLRETTPGYNLAYVVFAFANAAWGNFVARGAAEREFPVEVSVETLALEGRQGFVVALRHPRADDDVDELALRRLMAAAHGSDDAVLVTDVDGAIQYVNPAFEAMTGFSRREAVGQTPRILKSGARSAQFYARMWATLRRGESFCSLFANRRKGGETFFAEEHIRPFVDSDGRITHFVATLHDVSARVHTHKRLDFLANHDGLTGLPNRNLFLDRLHQEMARAARTNAGFALLFLDMDDFKVVNDRHGHAAGDELLRTIGSRLKRCVRDADTVARLGGDEFALLLVDAVDREGLDTVIEKISLLGQGIGVGEARVSVTLSVGVAIFPEDGGDAATLLGAADRDMYLAKADHKSSAAA